MPLVRPESRKHNKQLPSFDRVTGKNNAHISDTAHGSKLDSVSSRYFAKELILEDNFCE